MHILTGRQIGLETDGEAVDLGQSPGDIVVLSAADTEIAGLAAARATIGDAFPTTRLANWMALAHPYSIDLYSENILAQARLIVIRLLGGPAYWQYGVDEARRIARANGIALAILPGDGKWDDSYFGLGTVPGDTARRLWSYLAEGGAANYRNFLACAASIIGAGDEPPPAIAVPTCGQYDHPEGGGKTNPPSGQPVVAISFYRALFQSGQTAAIDALCVALAARGLTPLPIFVSSLKSANDAVHVRDLFAKHQPALVLNATAFAIGSANNPGGSTPLDEGRRPVLQITFSGTSRDAWLESTRGLSARDLTMNVVMPELDGRLITRAVSFKEPGALDPLTECQPVRQVPDENRIAFVADLARRWVTLGTTSATDKRVAILLSNYPNKNGRIGNGVGLDAPVSTINVLSSMRSAGYRITGAPQTSGDLMALLLAGPTNAVDSRRISSCQLSLDAYRTQFANLPETVRKLVSGRWGEPAGDPFVANDTFHLPAHRFGNVVIAIQPARGYNIDPKTSYHDPDLPPPHGYLAFYMWLREQFATDALIHMGKHGNLEWLPGKALALSQDCFPDAVLGPMPVIYPFIVNDPGEGAQAKRRIAATIVDHLMPPLARAESYGPAAALETLIDEYAAARAGDPRRAEPIAARILDLSRAHGFDADIGIQPGIAIDDALARLDEHICDLKELQIRDGLHILGSGPQGDQRAETLVALTRIPRGSGSADASLLRALANDLGLGDFDPLDCRFSKEWTGPRPQVMADLSEDPWRTCGDTVERLEFFAFDLTASGTCPPSMPATEAVLQVIRNEIAPALDGSGEREIDAVLSALAGGFVKPGPSGAPSRGRPDCLPTGRNFFSVDVRSVPTQAAWDLGWRSAAQLVERYTQDEGEWPKAMALTAWGTSNMRTGGDDIAQALALVGARPVWEPTSGRVTGIEVIPLSELGRPRIDITLRISGFFRDAFPDQIALFHTAVLAVAERDEPDDANPIAARIRTETSALIASGLTESEAANAAAFRIFGARPGAYGAGLQALIDEGIWATRGDLAEAFLEWSAYAYGGGAEGVGAASELKSRLSNVDAVVQNQDNREHDILDSDDYYQFEGGLAAAVETVKGSAPRIFHNDHSRPERPVIRGLDEEIARVVRGRAANPKWIAGQMRHGYKGAFEMAATVDYLFAFAATTNCVRHHHFDQLYDAYYADEAVRAFIAEHNPPALREIAARFCEAVDRGLWAPRQNSAYDRLRQSANIEPLEAAPARDKTGQPAPRQSTGGELA